MKNLKGIIKITLALISIGLGWELGKQGVNDLNLNVK